MNSGLFTMEDKKEIYLSWVHYTTKNEEVYFRRFIKGFVMIWESQLNLDWENLRKLPDWSTVKHDCGPHLSRLPEELLPAIGKFIYIAKDEADNGNLTCEKLEEVDLLVRCLTSISRNFDNIPLIASCDYVSHFISIATTLIHQLIDGTSEHIDEYKQFCKHLCQFLECIYDPYLTWRHLQPGVLPPRDKLLFHPSLLHVEVIPFIYDCFHLNVSNKFPNLSIDLINVLGAIVSGAQHNALRGICPATVNLLMRVVSSTTNVDVRSAVLNCFVAMIMVLHISPPHQRQIEVLSLLEMYCDVMISLLTKEFSKETLETEVHLVRTLNVILLTAGLHSIIVEAHIIEALLNMLEKPTKHADDSINKSSLDKMELATETVKVITGLVSGDRSGNERMLKIDGYNRLFGELRCLGPPNKTLLEAVVAMATGTSDSTLENQKLKNIQPLQLLIHWLIDLDPNNQIWLSDTLYNICTSTLQSKTLACENGTVCALSEVLLLQTIQPEAAARLVQLLEALASHSLSAYELKQLFLLLRTEESVKTPHRGLVMKAVTSITKRASLQFDCNSYFDVVNDNDGITISDMKKWSGAVYGFSFHCWLRLEQSHLPPIVGMIPSHRRQLFNFLTSSNTGIETFIGADGTLIVGVLTKKEFLAATVPEFSLLDAQWHCIDICYMAARRPFGHNQLSVFIDGQQKLAASMKFPAMTDPFVTCTVGLAAEKIPQNSQTKNDTRYEKMSGGLMERGLLPSLISQVPNYFSLPIRSSTPLDPNVKNFPPGMQDTLFGLPTCLQGQLGLFSLFHETLSPHQVKALYDGGPNCRLLFSPEDHPDMLVLNSKLVWCFSPAACWDNVCLDLAISNKFTAKVTARQCHIHTIKDVINGIGGVQVIFPILEGIADEEGLDLSVFSEVKSPTVREDPDDWVILPSTGYSEAKSEKNPVSNFLLLLKNLLLTSSINQEQLMKNNGLAILGFILSKMPPSVMDIYVLKALQLLLEIARPLPNNTLLRALHQQVLFNFNIWSHCSLNVRISHIQYISTLIKDERKIHRKRYGVQFFLDTIRRHYSSPDMVANEDQKAIRASLLGLIKYYFQKECNIKELNAVMGFLATCKEEIMVLEVLEMLISQLESKSCKDQLILLMYEPQAADLLYCILIDKNFSMDLKQRVLKMLSVLLRTEKIYERNKSRLRLQDSTTVGMYPGLIAMFPEQVLSMEFVAMLLDQILLTESNGSYSGALSLLHALSLAELDIKLEAARKLLTVTFMRQSAPQFLAKQVGWQDCVTRLLIKCPITSCNTETFPDLMVFDEEQDTEIETTRSVSPTSVSRISDAAYAIETEIKEVAETVTNAVADNIHFAADNISSAMASAYTAIRQKTVEMQESLELGARSRLKKRRSFTSSDSQDPEGSSPRAVRTSMLLSSLGLDLDNISFGNRSQSSSSTEDLSSPTHTGEIKIPAKDSVSIASGQSLASQVLDEDSEEDERILFDALQKWKALDAEKLEDKESELCHLVVNILFTIMWRGIDVTSKDLWKERGQVMTCINLLALNNVLYCSHLELRLRLLEMAVTATLSDLRDSTQTPESAAQLIRWIYDLTVLDPNQDSTKRASTKLLDGVLALLDSLLVFQEIPGEEWTEMAKLAFGILLSCAANTNLELCAMATAKLHTLIQTRSMKDMEEGGYLLHYVNTIVHSTLKNNNQEHFSFLMPVVKALIEKCSDMFSIPSQLPDLPVTHSGPVFYEDFQTYCQGQQWMTFIDKKIKPLYSSYQTALNGQLTEAMNVFWAECYEGSKTCIHRRNREVGESKLRFQSQILTGYRSRQTEETVRFNNLSNQLRNQELLVQKRWKHLRDFFTGPRGAWRSSTEDNTHWKLSHRENFSRMRLKLCPNLHFVPHTDASNLRDNTGWLSRMRSEEVPLSLNISSAVVHGETEDADYIPEEDLRSLGESEADGAIESGKEKLLLTQECDLVLLMSAVKGRLEVTTTHVYFFDLSPVKEDVERQDFKWPLSRLREIYLRRYNLRRSALEFFLIDQTNYFLNFTTKTRNRVVSRLLSLRPPNLSYHSSRSPADLLRYSGLTQKWVNHEITNFEYLMQLNTIAGRTYNDLSQYPVFPWIIADYTSEELDLTNPATFRDLSRPIGVVNPRNEAEVRAKYDSFEDPSGTIAKFHYGTHYSNSAGVLHYLVRVEPFTSLHIELQSGRFDVADRQFHSIPQTWKLLMDNPNDVKELTPEFFYFPEFLINMNKFDLGLLQVTKERVADVILPNWADSAENFIYKHRKALESEYVSAHLHEWIDLIFGYKQKGQKAVEALNVFYYCSYEGAVDLDAITNSVEREAVEGMINNFGQTPSQLLKEPHPQRLTLQEALARMLKSDSKKPDLTLFLDKLTPFNVEVSNDKDPVVFASAPRSPPKGFLQAGMPDCLVTISKNANIGIHGWLPHDRHSNRGFIFEIDQTLSSPKMRRNLSGSFHPSVLLHSHLFALSHDAKLLYTAGHWDSSVHVFSLLKNKVIASVIRHFDLVTCVALDLCGLYLVSGSRDCTCVVWDVSHHGGIPLRPVQTLYGHDKPVSCVGIATELDMVASGSLDGTVNIHTIKDGQYLRTLYPPGTSPLHSEISFISISAQGQVAIAAKDQKIHSVHVFSVNGTNLGSKYVAGRVTGLATAGDCLVVVDDAGDLTMSRLLGLHPVFDVPLHVPIQGVVVAPNNSHMLVPLRDGSITVIGVPNS
uniref:Neurobeachin-like protein 1 n=1 Tax=Clastoptera arizonana TaxID=38151 RepID=A0A1B6DB47_9HEMI